MRRIILMSLYMFVLFGTGCGGPKYVPDITLTPTGPIIDAIAEFHSLYPAHALLSGKDTFGLDAPKAERVEPSELTRQVERELLKELEAAGVFSRVTRFDPYPDVILTGRITALHEHYRPQVWAKISDFVPYMGSVAQLFRMNTHVSSGEAKLTVFVLKPTGEILGNYTGKSSFNETFTPTNDVPPGARLNQALSDAVRQIQDEIAHDVQFRKLRQPEQIPKPEHVHTPTALDMQHPAITPQIIMDVRHGRRDDCPWLPKSQTCLISQSLSHPHVPPPQGGSYIRVLVVDDHEMIRQSLRRLINTYRNMELVGEAGDGLEAIEAVTGLRPDVVLMDIDMPRMNGIEATKRIKATFPSTAIIGLSVRPTCWECYSADANRWHLLVSAERIGSRNFAQSD